jgi:hypothetical protein
VTSLRGLGEEQFRAQRSCQWRDVGHQVCHHAGKPCHFTQCRFPRAELGIGRFRFQARGEYRPLCTYPTMSVAVTYVC